MSKKNYPKVIDKLLALKNLFISNDNLVTSKYVKDMVADSFTTTTTTSSLLTEQMTQEGLRLKSPRSITTSTTTSYVDSDLTLTSNLSNNIVSNSNFVTGTLNVGSNIPPTITTNQSYPTNQGYSAIMGGQNNTITGNNYSSLSGYGSWEPRFIMNAEDEILMHRIIGEIGVLRSKIESQIEEELKSNSITTWGLSLEAYKDSLIQAKELLQFEEIGGSKVFTKLSPTHYGHGGNDKVLSVFLEKLDSMLDKVRDDIKNTSPELPYKRISLEGKKRGIMACIKEIKKYSPV